MLSFSFNQLANSFRIGSGVGDGWLDEYVMVVMQ